MPKKNKPTWIFVVGTYRTASTTQYEIIRDILEDSKAGKGVGYYDQKGWKIRNFDDPKHGKYIACKNFTYLPKENPLVKAFKEEGRLKAAGTIRDPRDIATSMMIRSWNIDNDSWSFEETVTEFFPVWLGQFDEWVQELQQDMVVSRFEKFTKDLMYETKRLSKFLEIELTPQQIETIASRYTTKEIMKRKKEAKEQDEREDEWLPAIPAIVTGKSGIYKEYLEPEQIAMVEEANEDFLKRWGYLT